MGPEFFRGWVSNRCCEACTCGLSLDDMKIKRFLNCYAGIYKILDGFPDSYNYLILSELSLSTPKPPLAKLIKIIKEVVGRLESGPSRIPNWPNNCVRLRFLFAVERGSAWRLACAGCLPPPAETEQNWSFRHQRSSLQLPTHTQGSVVQSLPAPSVLLAALLPTHGDIVHLLPDHRHKRADVQTPPLEDPTQNTACFYNIPHLNKEAKEFPESKDISKRVYNGPARHRGF